MFDGRNKFSISELMYPDLRKKTLLLGINLARFAQDMER